MDYRRLLGSEGEILALGYLQDKGLKLMAKNYRCRLGELDLVMRNKEQVVFVEVRTKSSAAFGTGLESITLKKRTKLKLVAQQFLAHYGLQGADLRFDIVSVCKPPFGPSVLEHVEGAF